MNVSVSMNATDQLKALRSGELSAVELLQLHLARIDQINPSINAICTRMDDQAIDAARAVDAARRAGAPLGTLAGLPVVLKDLTPTAGVRTTAGSRLYAERIPLHDAPLVERIRSAGGVIVGKSNTPEFGHKGVTDNALFGPTRNPWNPDRVAGGSSGGSAAALAAGMVALAEGSDGAGSIRIPASLCGMVGFKPTYGRVPDVAAPFASQTPFFHNGPMARCVDDAALFLRVLAGFDPRLPFSLPETPLFGVGGVKRPRRIAYSPDFGYFPVDASVASACRSAVEQFAALGDHVEQITLDLDADVEAAFMTFWRFKLASTFGGLPDAQRALLEPRVQRLIEEGLALSALDVGVATQIRERVWAVLTAVFTEHDLLISPTTSLTAFPVADDLPDSVAGQAINPLIGWFLTYPVNLTGHPAASLPCGFCADGLPVGLQVIGPRLADAEVLVACKDLELALDVYKDHRPPWSR